MLCMQARLAATAGADFYSITEDSARVDSRRTIPFQFSYRCDAGGYHESILNTDVLLLRGIVPVCRPAVHNEGLQADSSKTDDKQAYTKQVAEIVALVAVAPAHCGYIALFSMGWSVVVLIVEMVLAIWVGTKIMQ